MGEDLQGAQAAGLDHQLERPREQEVADQNRRGRAPDQVGCDLAAAKADLAPVADDGWKTALEDLADFAVSRGA
jgi:hypothetical protein